MRRQLISLGLILCLVLVASGVSAGELPWLKAEGKQLVDESGNPVILRTISLGGWLVEEPFMQPFVTEPPEGSDFEEVRDHNTLWSTVEKRLGAEAMARVRTAFRNNWIDESDFKRIHDDGFNCVRLGFLYDLLDEPDGWQWLDKAVEWAGKHQVYIVLDLHGAPGGQSEDWHTGWADMNRFFFEDKYVTQTEELWRKVAKRYRDCPQMAAFDLLNEPMGTPDRETLYDVTDRLYKAVRSVDKRHVIVIEDGYTGINHLPIPAERGWENVMCSSHHYQFNADSELHQAKEGIGHVHYMKSSQDRLGTPMFLGEVNHHPCGSPRSLAVMIGYLEVHGYSWALWSYKYVRSFGTKTLWGIYRNENPVEPLDPFRDTEQQMIAKCKQYRTENLQVYPGVLDAIIFKVNCCGCCGGDEPMGRVSH